MPAWTTFTAVVAVTTVLVLVLSRVSQSTFTDAEEPQGGSGTADDAPRALAAEISTRALLANVVVSQGAFLLLVVFAAWLFEIPAWAFGVSGETAGASAVLTGVLAGGSLYLANEVAAALGKRHGFAGSEELRARLAPESTLGWVALFAGVLPLIATFEELLFRGALVGVVSAGFGVSPWLLAVVSAIAFGFGHGAQGRLGVVVTGVLGFALAALYVVSGSLLAVIVAHYVVNALEFLVHERFGWEPFGSG
ncbi:MAG: CPBP family intramembrane glutamic endopeptidase [Haloferacaceae archaeon]